MPGRVMNSAISFLSVIHKEKISSMNLFHSRGLVLLRFSISVSTADRNKGNSKWFALLFWIVIHIKGIYRVCWFNGRPRFPQICDIVEFSTSLEVSHANRFWGLCRTWQKRHWLLRKRKRMRDRKRLGSWHRYSSFLSFLHRRERPLLAGRVGFGQFFIFSARHQFDTWTLAPQKTGGMAWFCGCWEF